MPACRDLSACNAQAGGYVRLAFAVAAHLEPEILLVDAVLAVGDAAFQKKCLGKMEDVAKEG
jgi:lipopolysaccharide transport system ATP-binding protein